MSETSEERRRHFLPRRGSVPLGNFKLFGVIHWDSKLVWVALTVMGALGGALLLFWLSNSTKPVGLWLFIIGLAYWLLIHKHVLEGGESSVLAKGTRVIAHKHDNRRGRNSYVSDRPLLGETFGDAERRQTKRPQLFDGVTIEPYERDGDVYGLVHNKRDGGTYSGTYRWHFSSLYSGDQLMRDSLIEGFAQFLDRSAEEGHRLHRFTWRDQTLLGEYQDVRQKIDLLSSSANVTARQGGHLDQMVRELEEQNDKSMHHRVTATLTIKASDVKAETRDLGNPREVLVQRLGSFDSLATGRATSAPSPIGLIRSEILDYNDLVVETRLLQDPTLMQPVLDGRYWEGLSSPDQLLLEEEAWAECYEFTEAKSCRIGETVHIGGYIHGFPIFGITDDQFNNLLSVAVPKTVAVVMEVLPFEKASRRARNRATGTDSMNRDRAAVDARVDAFDTVRAEHALSYEWSLATTGHKASWSTIYIVVNGGTLEEARQHEMTVRRACADLHFRYQPLTSQQINGVKAILPLGEGLK